MPPRAKPIEAPEEIGPAWTDRLIGHAEAEQGFLKAHESGRMPHAWLISGPKGVGKATLAYRMARFLLVQSFMPAQEMHVLKNPADADGSLPNLLCLGVEGVEAEPILLALDQYGVAVHSGSSCSSETLEPSPVLAAMEVDAERSLRVSVGWSSTRADVDRFVEVFPGIVERLRGLRSP